ncbi:MAG: hypothetical protein IKU05_04910 [Bacteroidales bacterium]|nr:hypothetical protein [Bacteroidales bacterium]
MAGAKETPRQKMIGMMYLVYTALLAMNVSADILDAFSIVNDGQEKTNASIEMKINDQYAAFEGQYGKEPEKTQIYWDKAIEIREKTDEMINYIEKEVKLPLLMAVEGINSEQEVINRKEKPLLRNIEKANPKNRRVFYEVELKNIGKKDDYDIPTTIMIEEGKATELKQKIAEYREFIVNTVENAGISGYNNKVGLLTDYDQNGEPMLYYNADKEVVDWEHKNFSHIVFVAEMAILNKIVGEVQTTEYDAVGDMMDRIGATDYKINKLQARVIAKSDYITQGQDYEAEVFLVAADTMRNFDAKYTLGTSNFTGKGDVKTARSHGGIVKLKIPGKNVGEQRFAGVIEMTNPETGDTEYHSFNASYIVAQPSATVAPTKMMVMYQELQNPISVSAPGVASDNLIVNVEGGTLTKDQGAGNYFVEVDKGAKTVKVNVSVKHDNKQVVQLATQEFRVKPVPNPVVNVGGYIVGGKVDKEELLVAGRVAATMKDFDFEGYNYTVDSYTVSTYKGNFIDKKNNGPRFNAEVMELINSARSGQRITFQDIMVKSPKGELRNMGSIAVVIK